MLEDHQQTIGVVQGVLGIRWFDCIVTGMDAHAGPTPMALRKDALTKAILPSFAKRCGPECVKTWNDTIGKTLNVTLAP